MTKRIARLAAGMLGLLMWTAPAQALPISFNIGSCVNGDCASFEQSGGGAIIAELDVINGNDLLITLTNALNRTALNDDPMLTNLGFEYLGALSGLTFDSFTVLSGTVATPSFTVDTSIRSFFIDFGFGFSDAGRTTEREGRFQAMDPQEVVQIVIGTTGQIDLSEFTLGVAKIGGTGTDGRGEAATLIGDQVASVPEPGSLLLMMVGAIGVLHRRTNGLA